MRRVVIIGALRTPLGAYRGSLRSAPATRLAGDLARELLARSGTPPSDVDELILGTVLGAGLGQNPARQAAAAAGIPFTSSALRIDMVCGSGLRAVCLAAAAIRLGEARVVIAAGAENMSMAPRIILHAGGSRRVVSTMKYDGLRCAFDKQPMGLAAEWLARTYAVSREEQDRFALECHRRTAASIDAGLFDAEIVPVRQERRGESACSRDECPRRNCTIERLSILKPAFMKDGTVTAGNATPIADGAAAVLLSSEEYARRRGLSPIARFLDCATAGVEPRKVHTATILVVEKLLARRGLAPGDVDVYELNDSFAVQGIVCRRALGLGDDRVNLKGSTLALGHPLGASGCRILVTLVHILRGSGKRRGIAAICLGGGNAVGALIEGAS